MCRTGLLGGRRLLLYGALPILVCVSVGMAAELPALLPLSHSEGTSSPQPSHSSQNSWTSIVDSFRLTSSVQVHRFTAPHAKDLWREVEDRRTVDLKTTATLVPKRLIGESEISYRQPIEGSPPGLGSSHDRQMVRMALNGTLDAFRYGTSYRSAGKEYVYVKDADKTMHDLWGEWRAGMATLRAAAKNSWSKVTADAIVTRLRQRQEQLSLALAPATGLALTLAYTHTATDGSTNQDGSPITQTESTMMDASLSYQASSWTAKLASSYTHGRVHSSAVSESDQFIYTLSGSYRPLVTVNIDPTITLKEDFAHATGVRTESPTAAMSMKYTPSAAVTWTGSGSYGLSQSTDGLVNTASFSAKNAVTWAPDRAEVPLPTTLSLETGYQQTTDRANADRKTTDFSALMRLQVAGF